MNIVESICQKYPIDYFMMPDMRAQSVSLTFGAAVDQATQDRVTEYLECMGIFPMETGNLSLLLDAERDGVFTLKKRGEILFRFANHTTGISFCEYNPCESIAWVIYLLSTQKSFLSNYTGQYISCKIFSARQQVAATRFLRCVHAQYQSVMTENLIEDTMKQLKQFADCFVRRVPLFSARPIRESAFHRLENAQNVTAELDRLCEELFGNVPFTTELDAFHASIKKGSVYKKRLDDAVQWLISQADRMPIMSVGRFFSELQNYISRMPAEPPTVNWHARVKFTMSPQGLDDCLHNVDTAYNHYITAKIQQAFISEVCNRADRQVDNDVARTRRTVAQTSSYLQMFCFMQESSDDRDLTWRQLMNPTDSDIFVPQTEWNTDRFHDLQQTIRHKKEPAAWLCSERLKNLSDLKQIAASTTTYAVPIPDEQYVWAIWADAAVE